MSGYEERLEAQHQARLQAKATIGTVLNEYYGILDQMMTAMHYGTMFVHARTGTLYFFVEEAQAFISSEGDIYLSHHANEPWRMPQGVRAAAARVMLTLEQDLSGYRLEALQRGWYLGKFYFPPCPPQGHSLASAFLSGRSPFLGVFNMDDVNNVIRAAQAIPGVSVDVPSTSTVRTTEAARSSSSGAVHPVQERHISQSPKTAHPPKHSTPTHSPDKTIQPKVEPEEEMPSVSLTPRNPPFKT